MAFWGGIRPVMEQQEGIMRKPGLRDMGRELEGVGH